MTVSLARLAAILDQCAIETTRRIVGDRAHGIAPHEPTLTQNFVSGLLRRIDRAGLSATAGEFTGNDESIEYGADLAVWFQNADGRLAAIYLQAKRQYPDDTYHGLNHPAGTSTQHALLIRRAAQDGALAGYAFYNGLEAPLPARSACPAHGMGAAEINGISVANAQSIAGALRYQIKRDKVEQFCFPLSCIIRHNVKRGRSRVGLATALQRLGETWNQQVELYSPEGAPEYVRRLAARTRERPRSSVTRSRILDDLELEQDFAADPDSRLRIRAALVIAPA